MPKNKVKKFSISLDKEIYDALEKKRKQNLGINRSRMIEVILAKNLGIKLKDVSKKPKRKCWFCFWR